MPGKLATFWFNPVKRLNSRLLPEFGLPIRAILARGKEADSEGRVLEVDIGWARGLSDFDHRGYAIVQRIDGIVNTVEFRSTKTRGHNTGN